MNSLLLNSPTKYIYKNSTTGTIKSYVGIHIYKSSSTRFHLQRQTYKNSFTKLPYETHLQQLNNEYSPTIIHSRLRNLGYKTLPKNTLLQKNLSTRTRRRQQTYENSLTKLSYETHLQELNYEYSLTIIHSPLRNLSYKILPRNTHLQKN